MNQPPNLNDNPFTAASKPGSTRRKYTIRNGVMGEVDHDYDRNCEHADTTTDPAEVPHCDRLLGLAVKAMRRFKTKGKNK